MDIIEELARAILKDIRKWQDETGKKPTEAGEEIQITEKGVTLV